MKTIFMSIPSPIIVRNYLLVPGGVFDILKKNNVRIVLIAPKQSHESLKRDFGDKNVIIESVKVNWKMSWLQRAGIYLTSYLNFTDSMYLCAAIGNRNDVPVVGLRRYFYSFKKLVSLTLGKLKWVRVSLAPKIDIFVNSKRYYKDLFDKYQPSLVFITDVFNLLGRNLLREAKRQRIKSMGMTASWDHFPKRFEARKPDTLLVWNEVLKKEAIELQNYKSENIFIVGVPQYDLFTKGDLILSRSEFLKKHGLDENKKLITFFSSSVYAPDDGDIVDMILRWLKEKKILIEAQIFLRPYPGVGRDQEKFAKFNNESLVYIDWMKINKVWGDGSHSWYPSFDSITKWMNLFYHSDIIINTYSSVNVEASVLLKPVININFDGYKNRPFRQSIKRSKYRTHYKHVFETKGVRQAESKEELFNYLNEFLKNPDVNKENLIKLREKMCFKVDGQSSQRIASLILKYV